MTFTTAVLLFGSLYGCSDRTASASTRQIADSSGGSVALGLASERGYRPMAVSAAGSVGGTISLQGASADTTAPVTVRPPRSCGDTAAADDVAATASSVANVLVWIDGIEAGKSLPMVRRETLVIEDCRFVPRVLAVAKGTTINVMSRDGVAHTSRFFRERGTDPIEEIMTVDAGQVVPSERIAGEAGVVEVRDAKHPWTRGYIAVFDHPYFAVTDERGSFTIDSLPPGTYTVKVWHERMSEPAEQRVVVSAGGVGQLNLSLALK